ncbi:DUF4169 family protein [Sphingomonas carotinifaciens]|uniref:DUF4169 family protein n=1 Tax=Sphingomonas carotinifaciens TaxID=1166323 RepID=A0A6N8M038_9SPHN|nr:DUF4169 family protein [Sphingomonas carotinifaciens]MBB4085817.1 hypothetical protein [Sphingomonas carotinifaciens]MWC45208.1 DUF4169 family protein [Sphingomonas carotinifaciens]
MGEVVNLRQARKRRARDDAAVTAAENRARFGRTRSEVAAERAEEARRRAVVDGARLDEPSD